AMDCAEQNAGMFSRVRQTRAVLGRPRRSPLGSIVLQKASKGSECAPIGPFYARRRDPLGSHAFPPFRFFFEDDMAKFTRLEGLLVSTGVAAVGSATLLALLAGNALTLAGASEPAADPSQPFVGPDFPICHTPVAKPAVMLRLAQTEVPRAEMSAANA